MGLMVMEGGKEARALRATSAAAPVVRARSLLLSDCHIEPNH
jgi:hypothetical protein